MKEEILKLISEEPDDRTIHWYWEPEGKVGKTALAKHIVMNKRGLYVSGRCNDVKCAIKAYLEKHNDEIDIVLWDIPRELEEYISFDAIESVKNGIFFCGKYESDQVWFDPPHVIIFANFEPRLSALSKDRWHVVKIN